MIGSNPSGSTITHNCVVNKNRIDPTSLLDWVFLFLDTCLKKTGSCICRTEDLGNTAGNSPAPQKTATFLGGFFRFAYGLRRPARQLTPSLKGLQDLFLTLGRLRLHKNGIISNHKTCNRMIYRVFYSMCFHLNRFES